MTARIIIIIILNISLVNDKIEVINTTNILIKLNDVKQLEDMTRMHCISPTSSDEPTPSNSFFGRRVTNDIQRTESKIYTTGTKTEKMWME